MSRPERTEAGQLAQNWTDALPAFLTSLPAETALREVRERAIARFAEQGLPDRKLESWRHTSLAALEELAPAAPENLDLAAGDQTTESFLETLAAPAGV